MTPVEFLKGAGDGTRVVIRYALHGDPAGSATDALGYLSGTDETHCVIATVRAHDDRVRRRDRRERSTAAARTPAALNRE